MPVSYSEAIEEKLDMPGKEVRLPRHQYFSENPDRIKEGYYRGQTEEKEIEERPMAPSKLLIKPKKSDRTKSTDYRSTRVLIERRQIRQSKRLLKEKGYLERDMDFESSQQCLDDDTDPYQEEYMEMVRGFFQGR